MENSEYRKIKIRDTDFYNKFSEKDLPLLWFISWHMTLNSTTAGSLLKKSVGNAVKKIDNIDSAPSTSFTYFVIEAMWNVMKREVEKDDVFADAPKPLTDSKYFDFVDRIDNLSKSKRFLYLTSTFGKCSNKQLSLMLDKSIDDIKQDINSAASFVIRVPKEKRTTNDVDFIKLSADFRKNDNSALANIVVPDIINDAVFNEYCKRANVKRQNISERKKPMNKNKKSGKKWIGFIVAAVAIIGVAAVLAFIVPKIKAASSASDISKIYTAEEVTYGDVDTEISGSGNLTPITNEIITADYDSEIEEIKVAAGDEVSEGDVIAIVTAQVTETTSSQNEMGFTTSEETTTEEEIKIKAPCDGIVTEMAVDEGDTISKGDEIGIVMGEDGFTLNVSADEDDISSVEAGQDVTVTVDALGEEYDGTVSKISYNGSTSGSSVSYQVTVQIDYEEGIYSGMSASCEIVTESSGEGLLVPVNAVQTSGDDSYVYIAPSGTESGDEYDSDEIDESDLEKVTVTTDKSDGTYIMIESDDIAEGDLILVPSMTSSGEGSEGSDSNSSFPGGGNMDFSNFDPNDMPQGGGNGGGFGGGQPPQMNN